MLDRRSWLWPDRTIGKRESAALRNEHNALVNDLADAVEALERALPYVAGHAVEREGYAVVRDIRKLLDRHLHGGTA